LLLFPREDACPLEMVRDGAEAVELVVPDGTWAQTRRLVRRHTALQRLRAVTVPEGTTRYLLRRNVEPGLSCTLEAIAAALERLEGGDVAAGLLRGFEEWQRAILALRGQLRLLDEPSGATPGHRRERNQLRPSGAARCGSVWRERGR
jgi:DTW domain-containing protein YfiP